MSYYPTIEEDLERAKAILAKGKAEPFMLGEQLQVPDGGTIYGGDTYAAYKLLESFVTEIEAYRHSFELYYKASMALMAAYKEANPGEYAENVWPDTTVVNQWAAAKIERLQIDPSGSDRIDELESALGHVAEGTVLVQRSMQAKLERATTERDEWERTAQNFHDLVDKFFGLFSDYEEPCTSFEQAESIWNDMKNREARLHEEKRQQLELLTQIRVLADQTTGTDRSKGDQRESGAIGAVKALVGRYRDRDELLTKVIRRAKELMVCGEQADEELAADRIIELMTLAMEPYGEHGQYRLRTFLDPRTCQHLYEEGGTMCLRCGEIRSVQ